MGYSFRLEARVLLYASSHRQDNIYHIFVVEHWLEREIAQWVHSMKDRSDDPLHHERTLLPSSRLSTVDIVSLLRCNGMTSRFSCGESVLQMLAQNKAILSWCGDSGTTTARAIVGVVGDAITHP